MTAVGIFVAAFLVGMILSDLTEPLWLALKSLRKGKR